MSHLRHNHIESKDTLLKSSISTKCTQNNNYYKSPRHTRNMAILEEHRRTSNSYYCLTKNIRLSVTKWKRVRIYLGTRKPTPAEVELLIPELEEKARSLRCKHTLESIIYLSRPDAEFLENIKFGFEQWHQKTPVKVLQRTNTNFRVRFSYNSNAIAGNCLTFRETSILFKDEGVSLEFQAIEYQEVLNSKKCLEYLSARNRRISVLTICTINRILTQNPDSMLTQINELVHYIRENSKSLHPFELACMAHGKLVQVHPFVDGNKRTARVLINLILQRAGYPRLFIPKNQRQRYYAALEMFGNGEYKAYVSEMLTLVKRQLHPFS